MCFNAFGHTSRPLETCFSITYFLTSGEVKNAFLKNLFFKVWEGKKRVLMHLRILPDHWKHVYNKPIFYHLQWWKTCFDALAHTSRPLETCFIKTYLFTSVEVKNAFWCICPYFETIGNMFLKNLFFTIWSGEKRDLMHLRILPDH